MTDLKIQHLLTLAFLLSRGAKNNFVPITTSSVGRQINRSQQAASKHLMELERGGFIERISHSRGLSVKITPEGYSQLVRISGMLRSSIDASPPYIELEGSPVSGVGEGAYYMSLDGYTRQFQERIHYVPFPGTLNVMLDGRAHIESAAQLDALEGVMIDGFGDGRRTYGWVKCFRATVNGKIPCHIIRLERTHHERTIIEIISRENIRMSAGLKDGSRVTIRIPADQ
jgi:riboflavin kinase